MSPRPSGGYETTHGALFDAPNSFWGLGPAMAMLNIFDGGRRIAGVKLSRAQYEEEAGNYRDTMLTAFREAEDAIAANRYVAAQAVDRHDAATAAQRTSDLAFTRYRDGASDYFQVVTAQTDTLTAERALLTVETQRMRASIALVKAVGGDVMAKPR